MLERTILQVHARGVIKTIFFYQRCKQERLWLEVGLKIEPTWKNEIRLGSFVLWNWDTLEWKPILCSDVGVVEISCLSKTNILARERPREGS